MGYNMDENRKTANFEPLNHLFSVNQFGEEGLTIFISP